MRAFDFVSHATRLQRATKRLHDEWEQLSEVWDDAVRIRFEQRYLEPMKGQIQAAHASIYEFAELVQKVASDLEE